MSFVEETFLQRIFTILGSISLYSVSNCDSLHQRMMKKFGGIFHRFKINLHILEDDLILHISEYYLN